MAKSLLLLERTTVYAPCQLQCSWLKARKCASPPPLPPLLSGGQESSSLGSQHQELLLLDTKDNLDLIETCKMPFTYRETFLY